MWHLVCCRVVRQDGLLVRWIISSRALARGVVISHVRDWPLDLMHVGRHCLLGKTSWMVRLVMAWLAFRYNFRFEFILRGLLFNLRFLILKLVFRLHRRAMVSGRRYWFDAFHETSLEVAPMLLLVLRILKLHQVVDDRGGHWHLVVWQACPLQNA